MDRRETKIRAVSSNHRLTLSSTLAPGLPKPASTKGLQLRSHLLVGLKSQQGLGTTSHRRIPTSSGSRPFHSPHTSLGEVSVRRTVRRSESQVIKVGTEGNTAGIGSEKPSLPLSPAELLASRRDDLAPYEQSEVLAFERVYFLGNPAAKRPAAEFDTEKGDYQLRTGEHLAYRYEVISLLGKGSFGVVAKCFDHKRHEHVAIKIIKSKKIFHQQGAVEVKVLQTLRDHNKDCAVPVVTVKASFVFRKHLCIAFEMLSRSLYEFMKINRFRGLPVSLTRKFSLQILHALSFIRLHHIIHCDLKPENILLRSESKASLKLIDFGSSCFDTARVFSYIQSRFYRAPEIILGVAYTGAIDMWSLGCVLVEMVSGVPAFTGTNEREQLALYMEVLGPPPASLILQSPKHSLYFTSTLSPKITPDSKGKMHYPGTKTLAQLAGLSDSLFLDLAGRCLDWSPTTRLTPEQAIAHPWISQVQ